MFLAFAVVGVVEIEDLLEQRPFFRQRFEDAPLRRVSIEFAALFTFEEEEVNLSVVVGEGALRGVAEEARNEGDYPDADAPVSGGAGYELVGHSESEADVDSEEPEVAGESVEHTSDHCFLVGDAGELSVGGVAEVGEHEKKDAEDIVREVREGERDAGSDA